VLLVAGQMYKSMGVGNDQISRWTGIIGFAWVFKPLWSPFLEALGTNRSQVVLFQFIGGASLLGWADAAPAGVLRVEHRDARAGGDRVGHARHRRRRPVHREPRAKQQAEYAGWQGAFYNAAKFASAGGLLILAGYLEKAMPVAQAWTIDLRDPRRTLIALGLYHCGRCRAASAWHQAHSMARRWRTLQEVFVAFFRKPGIWLAILFIILFRAGEGQVGNIAPLFLRDPRSVGGLGLDPAQVGWAYGTAGTLAFIFGSIVGGYFAAGSGCGARWCS
jgi:PAT family beta-lactamase induction signal transducer AmpG